MGLPSEPRQVLQVDDDGRMAPYFLRFSVSLLSTTCKMICQLLKELSATAVPGQAAVCLDALQKGHGKVTHRIASCLHLSRAVLAKCEN